MTSILEGELAQTISDALIDASIPYVVTVTRTVPGEPDPSTPWIPGEPVATDYPCQGFTETYSEFYLAAGLVQANDLKVVVLLPTITITPAIGDTVTVRGKTYNIINASPDPALATIELQARA